MGPGNHHRRGADAAGPMPGVLPPKCQRTRPRAPRAATLALLAAVAVALVACPAARAARLSAEAIRQAADYSGATGEVALIIWQNGSVRLQRESDWLRQRQGMHDVRSITKSMWALALLAAAEQGRVRLDDPVAPWLPEWRDDRRGALTFRQLMQMTSGLDPNAARIYRQGHRDLNHATLASGQRFEAGRTFRYGPSGPEAAWLAWQRALATRGEAPERWFAERTAGATGAAPPWWRRDEQQRPFASAGARTRPHDLLQLGIVLVRDGRAQGPGRRQVLSRASIDQALRGSAANPAYGFGFWLNHQAARADAVELFVEDLLDLDPGEIDWHRVCLSRQAPPELAVMLGSSGQRVYLVRSSNLVVVRLGEGKAFRDHEFLARLFAR